MLGVLLWEGGSRILSFNLDERVVVAPIDGTHMRHHPLERVPTLLKVRIGRRMGVVRFGLGWGSGG